ncbi:S-layer homology domain-containing protein [Paenibacillus sp. UNCCL117]|uniref:S-layer homology domain-containing protein n=1 Tax=unclassified Paenibacillus TaxID=185978 RepID=UPI000884B04E|nr:MULTISPECIES: S-layer homology domain-containing protein [unclassified Paenibacillus]SDE19619.1 S-layer homology domain-containing protein [Paenibacillus sp. cl123]SFW61973.1 S-layer homology domain-containing protein [Paenibacillus sp. UNCCL117]
MKNMLLSRWNTLLIVIMLFTLFPQALAGASMPGGGEGDGAAQLSAAAAAGVTEAVYVQSSDGQFQLPVNLINFNVDAAPQKNNYVALFTSGAQVTNSSNSHEVYVKKTNVAIAVDKHDRVIRVIGPTTVPVTGTGWEESQQLPIPDGGYVLLANDSSWGTSVYRKPLFEHFKTGDLPSLHRGNDTVHAEDFLSPDPGLQVLTPSGTTVTSPSFSVAGQVTGYTAGQGIRVTVNGTEAPVKADGSFQSIVQLLAGTNAIAIQLFKGAAAVTASTVTVTYNPSQPPAGLIEVEAAPIDITINIEGPRHEIGYIDRDISGIDNTLALFTTDWGTSITIPALNVAVQVDAANKVLQVVNPSIGGLPPVWSGPTELAIPPGGYILVAQDTSYGTQNFKKYLAVNFKIGDTIKLRKNGLIVPVRELMNADGPTARLTVDQYAMYTETKASTLLSGSVSNYTPASSIVLTVNGIPVPIGADGRFSTEHPLAEGVNYVDLAVTRGGKAQDVKSIVVFSRPGFTSDKKVILWVDQAANARKFKTSEHVRQFLQTAKGHGVTSVVLDVKGVEGFVSYKKSTLTQRPYVSMIQAPEKAGSNPDLDLLDEFVKYSRELGLDIHTAFNIFAEGSITSKEYAVLNDHLDWEERVYAAVDNGQIKRLRESGKQGAVAFVNPSHDGVRDFQLKTIEEVLQHYDVDGVVLDRARYDNETADFSDLTRAKFEAFLEARGKQLVNWPADVFRYVNDVRVDGPLVNDWWEFRSKTIKSFTSEVRELADRYTAKKGKKVQVSAYDGSWFETYYLNGVHWGSPNFRYDEHLKWKDSAMYSAGYYESGYVNNLDFIMIGAYQKTAPEIQHYMTLGNIVTHGEVPLYAGIAMTNVQEPALQREVFQAGLAHTHGLMLFDASQVNWPVAGAALKDQEYVKDYQLGISLPGQPDSFMEGSYYNASVIAGNIGVLTEEFGYSTGNSRFGVEAVVDSTGRVTRIPNRSQAINWNWGQPEETNSVIPQGGFVVSAMDPSGTRTKRQWVAGAYQVGDQVRAAALSGFLPFEQMRTGADRLILDGSVKVLGPGNAEVTVNGAAAGIAQDGSFQANLSLQPGQNTVTLIVKVDGYKTNEKTLTIVRDEQAIRSLQLVPGRLDLRKGEQGQLSAKAEYGSAVLDVTGQAGYTSSEPAVVQVDRTGKLTALKEGTSVIQAVYEGHRASAEVRVFAADSGSGSDGDSGSGNDSGGGSGSSGPQASPPMERSVVSQQSGPDGRGMTVVTVRADALKKELASLAGQARPDLRYAVPGSETSAAVVWPGSVIREAADAEASSGALLVMESHLGSYELPIGLLKGMLPQQDDFELVLRIEQASQAQAAELGGQAARQGMKMLGTPVSFQIEVKSGERSQLLPKLGSYAKRMLKLPGQATDAAPTAVVKAVADSGRLLFVPARFESGARGEGWKAAILDRSGGMYAAVVSDVRFADLAGHWSRQDVEALASKGIVEGTSEDSFSPESKLTRAGFVTLLTRALGLEPTAAAAEFTDVPADAWYASAVGAAVQAGLVDGFRNGEFRPDDAITREQLSVLAMRALKWTGASMPEHSSTAVLEGFADSGSLSEWARESAAQALATGLLQGREEGAFVPAGTVTRAEGTVVLRRLLQKAGFIN